MVVISQHDCFSLRRLLIYYGVLQFCFDIICIVCLSLRVMLLLSFLVVVVLPFHLMWLCVVIYCFRLFVSWLVCLLAFVVDWLFVCVCLVGCLFVWSLIHSLACLAACQFFVSWLFVCVSCRVFVSGIVVRMMFPGDSGWCPHGGCHPLTKLTWDDIPR